MWKKNATFAADMKMESIVIGLFLLAHPVFGQTDDRIVTGEQLLTTSHTSLLTALHVWMPEYHELMPVLVDGALVPASVLQGMSVYDINTVELEEDPMVLMKWGVSGASAMLNVTTRKAVKGGVQATYRGDAVLSKAVGESNGLPTQTGWLHQHQVDVEGGDKSVSYLFSARCIPNSRDVLKGMGLETLALRACVDYRSGSLYLHNDLSFHHATEDQSSSVRYQVANSQGSLEEEKNATLTDRFGAQIDLMRGLTLNGQFHFMRKNLRHDRFLSPTSDWFAKADDVRQHGTYHKGNASHETYEGSLDLDFDRTSGRSKWQAQLGANLYSGTERREDYGGMGILSDRMAYISFTLGYDTMSTRQSQRQYDRELRGWLTAQYEYEERYGIAAGATLSRSSLLAPGHRNALHWSASSYWRLHNEQWLKGTSWTSLTLTYTAAQLRYATFSYESYLTTYKNLTQEQYIYNYYLTGSALQGLANADLKPSRLTSHQLMLQGRYRGFGGFIEARHESMAHLPGYAEQPLRTGFTLKPVSEESFSVNVYEVGADGIIYKCDSWKLNGQLDFGYEKLCSDDISSDDDYIHFSAGLQAVAGRWQAAVSCGGDRHLGMSSVQAGYRFGHLPHWLKELELGATAINLVNWHPSYLLSSRQYALSVLLKL